VTNPHPHPTDFAHEIHICRMRILAGSVTSLPHSNSTFGSVCFAQHSWHAVYYDYHAVWNVRKSLIANAAKQVHGRIRDTPERDQNIYRLITITLKIYK